MDLRRRRGPLLAFLLLSVPSVLAGQASNEVPPEGKGPYQRHPEAVKAIDQLKSPYCPGLMLEVCPSPGGAALRDSLSMLADQGWPADSIVGWVLARHGPEWLALPRREGKALVAWIIPPLAALAGLVLVVVALRKMRRSRPLAPEEQREITPEEEARLRDALRDLEAEEEAPFL